MGRFTSDHNVAETAFDAAKCKLYALETNALLNEIVLEERLRL